MKSVIVIFLLTFPFLVNAVSLKEDFWLNCPGPACPANKPDIFEPKLNDNTEMKLLEKEKFLYKRERELLEREKIILEREMKFNY